MKKEDLFGIISDIDDKYIMEAHEEDLAAPSEASSSTPEKPAPVVPVSKNPGRIRILIPIAAGIAALALICFGLWKSGIFSKKDDPVIEHKDTVIEVTDYIDPEFSEIEVVVTNDVTETTVVMTKVDPTGDITASSIQISDPNEAKAELSVRVPADRMIEKDGELVPSALELTITNNGDHPLYFINVFRIEVLGTDGQWVHWITVDDQSVSFKDFCVAPGQTVTKTIGFIPEHQDYCRGTNRLLLWICYYEGEADDWTVLKKELDENYCLAGEFEI